jgi:hypothetical protein
MRQNLKVVMLIACCLSVLSQSSWGSEQVQPEGILNPLCSPCKTLCEKTLKLIPAATVADMKCPVFGTLFSTTCEAISAEGGPIGASVCFSGGIVAGKVCEEIYGSPHALIEDSSGAAKHICKGIKFCKK